MTDSICYKYWQAKNMIMTMCQDRGYKTNWETLRWTLADFFPHFQSGIIEENKEWFMPEIGFECINPKTNQTVSIAFFKPEATGKEAVISLLNHAFIKKIQHIILILPYPLSHQAVEVLENQDMQDFDVAANKKKVKKSDEKEDLSTNSKEIKESSPTITTNTTTTPSNIVNGNLINSLKNSNNPNNSHNSNTVNNVNNSDHNSSINPLLLKKNNRPIVEVELFDLPNIQFSWTVNASQPLVYELNEKETQDYFAKCKLQPSQISGLLMDDPLCRWYKFEKGKLIRLTPRDQLHRPDFVIVGNQK